MLHVHGSTCLYWDVDRRRLSVISLFLRFTWTRTSRNYRSHGNRELCPELAIAGRGSSTAERHGERCPKLGTEQTVDDEVQRRVDVDEQLADVVQIEDGVAARVAVGVAHEVERAQRRLTQDGDDDDGHEDERHFLRRSRHGVPGGQSPSVAPQTLQDVARQQHECEDR